MPVDPDPLFERLQRALEPDYRLEREIGRGGMGKVFLATDLTLNCPVAVKVMRIELVTAHAAEAFTREAQILAQVRHPNIVTIHQAPPSKEGLHFYIMEFVDGPTLEKQLERGPLSVRDARKMGRDLLAGLEAVHRAGIVHRDVKPSNVFLISDPQHAKLSDFGIARAPTPPQRDGDERGSVTQEGTPGYQALEQISGGPITPATDLYQAGLVIYEALTNERYTAGPPSWRGVPRSIAKVLRVALEDEPAKRWPDARTFRHALWRTRILPYLVRAAMLAIGGIIVGATAVIVMALVPPSGTAPGTLTVALPPFEYVGPPAHAAIADSLGQLLRVELRSHPDFRVRTTRWWFVRWPFRSPFLVIRGRVAVAGSDINVHMWDARLRGSGAAISDARTQLPDWATLRDSLTYRVLLAVWDSLSPLHGSLPHAALPHTPVGLALFLEAEQLVAAGKWQNAYIAYTKAEQADSTCLLCSWRLYEVERWLALQHDPARLHRILSHIDAFPAWYKSLIRAAQLPLPQRLDTLRAETAQYRDFFLGYMQLGDELFHRGPLEGHARAEAIPALEQAARLRPDFAPAWEHLAWVDITEGDSAGAALALRALDRRNVGDDPFALALRALLGVAFSFRFLPEQAAIDTLRHALADTVVRASSNLAAGPRMLGAFDVPHGEIVFGEILAAIPAHDLQRSGLTAQLFGSIATGNPTKALALAQRLGVVSSDQDVSRFRTELAQTISELERASVSFGSPFFPTVTRLRLADQLAQRGVVDAARRTLLWHEHTDIVGLPTGPPQAAEVDWAFGTLARWRLGALLATSNPVEACKAYRDVVRLWSDGEPLYRARADTARQRITELHCGS